MQEGLGRAVNKPSSGEYCMSKLNSLKIFTNSTSSQAQDEY
jgi:hypothetical protein